MILDFPGTQEMHLESLALRRYHSTIVQIRQGLRTWKKVIAMVLTQTSECSMETVFPHGNNSYHRHQVSIHTATEIGAITDEISRDISLSNKSSNDLSHLLCEKAQRNVRIK
jgi:hypothetical protein